MGEVENESQPPFQRHFVGGIVLRGGAHRRPRCRRWPWKPCVAVGAVVGIAVVDIVVVGAGVVVVGVGVVGVVVVGVRRRRPRRLGVVHVREVVGMRHFSVILLVVGVGKVIAVLLVGGSHPRLEVIAGVRPCPPVGQLSTRRRPARPHAEVGARLLRRNERSLSQADHVLLTRTVGSSGRRVGTICALLEEPRVHLHLPMDAPEAERDLRVWVRQEDAHLVDVGRHVEHAHEVVVAAVRHEPPAATELREERLEAVRPDLVEVEVGAELPGELHLEHGAVDRDEQVRVRLARDERRLEIVRLVRLVVDLGEPVAGDPQEVEDLSQELEAARHRHLAPEEREQVEVDDLEPSDGALDILVLLSAPRRDGGPRARRARADDHLEILPVLSDDVLLPKIVLARGRLRRGSRDVLPRHVRTLSLGKQRREPTSGRTLLRSKMITKMITSHVAWCGPICSSREVWSSGLSIFFALWIVSCECTPETVPSGPTAPAIVRPSHGIEKRRGPPPSMSCSMSFSRRASPSDACPTSGPRIEASPPLLFQRAAIRRHWWRTCSALKALHVTWSMIASFGRPRMSGFTMIARQ